MPYRAMRIIKRQGMRRVCFNIAQNSDASGNRTKLKGANIIAHSMANTGCVTAIFAIKLRF